MGSGEFIGRRTPPHRQHCVSSPSDASQALLNSPAKGSLNPIFVSPGHRLSLRTCVLLTLACTRNGKVPEPIRSADLYGESWLLDCGPLFISRLRPSVLTMRALI